MPPAEPSACPSPRTEAIDVRPWFLIAWHWTAMAIGLIYWLVLGLLVTLLGGTLSFILPKRRGEALGRGIHHVIFRVFVAYLRMTGLVYADLAGLEKLGRISSPIIVAPNHSPLWDAVFIIARLPQAICVMKKSILHNPCLGGGSRLSGYIPNGSTTGMIREAAASLQRGGQLLLFPEGTRTRPDARWINPLKGGCALIAQRAGVPVHPVFIRSDSRYLQKGCPLCRPPVFPIRVSITTGEPLFVREGESASEFTERLQAVYEQELSRPHPLRRRIED